MEQVFLWMNDGYWTYPRMVNYENGVVSPSQASPMVDKSDSISAGTRVLILGAPKLLSRGSFMSFKSLGPVGIWEKVEFLPIEVGRVLLSPQLTGLTKYIEVDALSVLPGSTMNKLANGGIDEHLSPWISKKINEVQSEWGSSVLQIENEVTKALWIIRSSE